MKRKNERKFNARIRQTILDGTLSRVGLMTDEVDGRIDHHRFLHMSRYHVNVLVCLDSATDTARCIHINSVRSIKLKKKKSQGQDAVRTRRYSMGEIAAAFQSAFVTHPGPQLVKRTFPILRRQLRRLG